MYMPKEEKLDNLVRWTITMPLSLAIKIDIERKATNDTKSSWIRKALEEKTLNQKIDNIDKKLLEKLTNEIEELKKKVDKTI